MLYLVGMFCRNNHIEFYYISSQSHSIAQLCLFSVFFLIHICSICFTALSFQWKKKLQLRKKMNIKFRTPRSTDPNSQMIALKCTFYFQIWDIIIWFLNDSNVMYFSKLSLTSLLKMMQTIKIMETNYKLSNDITIKG